MSEGKKVIGQVTTALKEGSPWPDDEPFDALLELSCAIKWRTCSVNGSPTDLFAIKEIVQWGRTYKITVEEVEEPA